MDKGTMTDDFAPKLEQQIKDNQMSKEPTFESSSDSKFTSVFMLPQVGILYECIIVRVWKEELPFGPVLKMQLDCMDKGIVLQHTPYIAYKLIPNSQYYKFCMALFGREKVDSPQGISDSEFLGKTFYCEFIQKTSSKMRVSFPIHKIKDLDDNFVVITN